MTGPTTAISVTVALPGASVLPSLLSVGAPVGTPGTVPTLANFVDLMIGQPQVTAKAPAAAAGRQADAETGNVLPDDKKDETADPALAWLLAAPVAATPEPVAPAVPTAGAAAKGGVDVAARAVPVSSDPVDPRVGPQAPPNPQPVTLAGDLPVDPAPQGDKGTDPALVAEIGPVAVADTPPVEASDTPAAEATTKTPPVPSRPIDPRVGPQSPRTPQLQVQPSTRTIAAAMLRSPQAQPVTLARALAANAGAQPALFALAMNRADDERDVKPIASATVAATLLTPADAAALIAKPGEAQRQALDMGQPDWPQKMIDRIETLRDAANANDTSIRLKPEALGRVDISLKTHADGAVSVRFTAEQPATRTMIADSAPQLQAAAEARGIRLAQTSVDLAGSGQGERQRQHFELQQNLSNRLAASGEADTSAVADGRIA